MGPGITLVNCACQNQSITNRLISNWLWIQVLLRLHLTWMLQPLWRRLNNRTDHEVQCRTICSLQYFRLANLRPLVQTKEEVCLRALEEKYYGPQAQLLTVTLYSNIASICHLGFDSIPTPVVFRVKRILENVQTYVLGCGNFISEWISYRICRIVWTPGLIKASHQRFRNPDELTCIAVIHCLDHCRAIGRCRRFWQHRSIAQCQSVQSESVALAKGGPRAICTWN